MKRHFETGQDVVGEEILGDPIELPSFVILDLDGLDVAELVPRREHVEVRLPADVLVQHERALLLQRPDVVVRAEHILVDLK